MECSRKFEHAYLGLALWQRLDLHTLLAKISTEGKGDVGCYLTACVLALGRCAARA
jgi:hypothetical protein